MLRGVQRLHLTFRGIGDSQNLSGKSNIFAKLYDKVSIIMIPQLNRRLMNTKEYHLMAKVGILGEDDRVELINGEIITMSPIGNRHVSCVNRINSLFNRLTGERTIVSIQNPIHIANHSEPEPDIVILKPSENFYSDRLPGPEDVYFLIEVAGSSLEFDRNVKLPLYAAAGIPEVWIINLEDSEIEVHKSPQGKKYTEISLFDHEGKIHFTLLDLSIKGSQLLG